MPALEDPKAETAESAQPETDVAAEKEAAQELKVEAGTEAEMPIVEPVAVAATTASTMAFDNAPKGSGDTKHLDSGVHHWETYKQECEAAGRPDKWKDQYRVGHTEAKGWTNPYEHQPYDNRNAKTNDWELKPRTSASRALKDWLAGPTIADFRAAAVAKELDDFRQELGDGKFDELLGSSDDSLDKKIPTTQRLRISSAAYGSNLVANLKQVAFEAEERGRAGELDKPTLDPAKQKPVDDTAMMIEPELEAPAPDREHV